MPKGAPALFFKIIFPVCSKGRGMGRAEAGGEEKNWFPLKTNSFFERQSLIKWRNRER